MNPNSSATPLPSTTRLASPPLSQEVSTTTANPLLSFLTNTGRTPRRVTMKQKAVVTVDFGTHGSAIGFALRDVPDHVQCSAPSNRHNKIKVPTVLYQGPDQHWLFGEDALARYAMDLDCEEDDEDEMQVDTAPRHRRGQLFKYFKMGLRNADANFQNLRVKSVAGQEHNLMELIAISLQFLSEFAVTEMNRGYASGLNIDTNVDILWVITIPAIWNDFAKLAMRKAAVRAGMIASENSNQLLFALEPEAAALAVHAGAAGHDFLAENEAIAVGDYGGGTFDLTVLCAAGRNQNLVLHGVCSPKGGPWGGIFVDEEFKSFVATFFGSALMEWLEAVCKPELEELWEDFCNVKESYDPAAERRAEVSLAKLWTRICEFRDDEGATRPEGLPTSLLELVERYNALPNVVKFDHDNKSFKKKLQRQSKLVLAHAQMLQFFEPTLQESCQLIREVLQTHSEIRTFALVGGYGSSKVVQQRIRTEFNGRVRVFVPDGRVRPQAAILHGAACFGLWTEVIGTRTAQYSYGVETSELWTVGCGFDETTAIRVQGERWIQNVFSLVVRKGDRIAPSQEFAKRDFSPRYAEQKKVQFRIFKSDVEQPRLTTDAHSEYLGELVVDCRPGGGDRFDVAFKFSTELVVEIIRGDQQRFRTTLQVDAERRA